jgi:hypothetical protein
MSSEIGKNEHLEPKRSDNEVSKFFNDAYHNPVVDVAVGVVAGAALMAGAGKVLPLCERLFPSAEELLAKTGLSEGSLSEARLSAEAGKVIQNLSSRTAKELGLTPSFTRSPAVLDKLAEHSDPRVLESVAYNEATAPETLTKLLNNTHTTGTIEEGIASHPNAPPTVLAKLAQLHPDSVAANASTSASTLDKLSKLDDFSVARRIAEHANANPETLDRLSHSSDPWTLRLVAMNPNTSTKTLASLPYDTISRSFAEYLTPTNLDKLIANNTFNESALKQIAEGHLSVQGMSQEQVKEAIAARHS